MKAVGAIAVLALRLAVRSRLMLAVLALLILATFLLPLALRSDGTAEGIIRLHLTYTLGLAGFLLTLATLWSGGAAISLEAEDKTLQMLLIKPVPRWNIWLGKWLALVVINSLMLGGIGAATLLTLHWKLLRAGLAGGELEAGKEKTLAALEVLAAPVPGLTAEVEAEYESGRARGVFPTGVPPKTIKESIRRTLLAREYSVAPGGFRRWPFGPLAFPSGRIWVQFKCDSSLPGIFRQPVELELSWGEHVTTQRVEVIPGSVQWVAWDVPAAAPMAPAQVIFRHLGTTDDPTLFFDPADGLVLRRPAGSFAGNYLRALLILFLRLMLFAAIGVTLGTLFSSPVAAFLALVLILILQLSGFISAAAQVDRATFVEQVARFGADHSHGETTPSEPSWAARAAAHFLYFTYRGTWLFLRPLLEDRTLEHLTSARYIPPRILGQTFLHQGLFLPLLLGGLSTLVLCRREWAVPE